MQDVYDTLLSTGFKGRQIEDAMSNTIPCGGDVIDALDWLCLFTPNGELHYLNRFVYKKKCVLAFSDELPDGFSNVLKQEEDKVREKFDETLHAKKLEPDAAEDTQDTEANLKSSLNLVT